MPGAESVRLAVIVERRESGHPWQAHAWLPVEVRPVVVECSAWRLLAEGPGWRRYLAATLPLELFPRETEAYRVNLTAAEPVVYVILRPGEGGEGREVEPFLITVSADEVQEYLDAGDDIVEGVAMPSVVRAWVEGFVARHHKEVRFEKRARRHWSEATAGRDEGARARRLGRGPKESKPKGSQPKEDKP